MQRILARELPYVSLWHEDRVWIVRKPWQGISLKPSGSFRLLTAKKDEGAMTFVGLIGRKLLARLPGVLGVMLGPSLLVSATLRLVPGDPVTLILGEQATEADRARLEDRLGLNASFASQYVRFLSDVTGGNLESFQATPSSRPSVKRCQTLILSIFALLLSASPGLSWASLRRSIVVARCGRLFASIGLATPHLWADAALAVCGAVGLFPVGGNEGWSSLVLPVLSLGTAMAAMLAYDPLEPTKYSVWTTSGRRPGLSGRVVVGRRIRNALIPVITIWGSGGLPARRRRGDGRDLRWPGIRTLLLKSIQTMDFPMVQGCILVIAGTYVITNLIVDIIYEVVDPRMKT